VKYTQTAGIYRRRLTTRYWPVSSVLGYRHAPDSSAASKCSVRLYSGRRRLDHDWPSSALATVIPVTGWAADRFGTKPFFITSVLAFTLGPVLCEQAPTMLLLILFRMLQVGRRHVCCRGNDDLTREAGPKRLGRLMAVLGIPGRANGWAILGGWLISSCEWKPNLANGGIGAWCGPGGVHVRPGGISAHGNPGSHRNGCSRLGTGLANPHLRRK
jgi:hypothetical protein